MNPRSSAPPALSVRSPRLRFLGSAVALVLLAACTSSTSSPSDAGTTGGSDGSSGAASCSAPGQPTVGAADTHCQGMTPQPVSEASCHVDAAAGDDGGADACPYGDTIFGNEGDDDDCKYHVKWSSTPLCEGGPGVTFTATITNKTDGTPVSGVPDGIALEAFIPTTLDASCDDRSTHPSPSSPNLVETAAGSGVYKGNVEFDAPGEWTLRFHIHEECGDAVPSSPHGHAAFHLTLP